LRLWHVVTLVGVKVYGVTVKDLAGRFRCAGSADDQEGEMVIPGTDTILVPIITVTQWQLKPEGNSQGAIQSQFTFSMEVTQ
jgi:hypothetical protein